MKPDTLRRLHRPLSHTVLMTALMALGWSHAPVAQATTGAGSKTVAVNVTREQAEAEVLTAQALALEHGEQRDLCAVRRNLLPGISLPGFVVPFLGTRNIQKHLFVPLVLLVSGHVCIE